MILLVCGDRNWTDRKKIKRRLKRWLVEADAISEDFMPRHLLIHGAARGVDTIAGELGLKLRFDVKAFPADWEKHGKSAGPIRNRKMLDQCPHLVIAFHSDIEKSKGTKDCIFEANRRKMTVEIIP